MNSETVFWAVVLCAQIVAVGYLLRAGGMIRSLLIGSRENRRRHSLARWLPVGGTLRGPGLVDSGRRDRLRAGDMGSGS